MSRYAIPASASTIMLSTPKRLSSSGKSTSGPGNIALVTKMPATPTAAAQATGRQRRDGRWPSGNSSTRKLGRHEDERDPRHLGVRRGGRDERADRARFVEAIVDVALSQCPQSGEHRDDEEDPADRVARMVCRHEHSDC